MKKLIKIIVGLLVLVVVGLIIFFFLFDKAQAPQVIVPTQNVPAGWTTYTDPKTGISLQAPEGLIRQDHSSYFLVANPFLLAIPTTTPYVHTHLLHEALIAINPPAVTCPLRPNGSNFATSTIMINGVSFERNVWSDVGAGNVYQGVDYITAFQEQCYRIGLFTHSTNGEGFYSNDPEQIKKIDALQAMDIKNLTALFDQIASTIKFVK